MSDDNKVKLLKIQHALLEALAEKKKQSDNETQRKRIDNELATCLLRYQELVTEIDYGIYRELQDKIKKITDSEHTLEEELLELEEIEMFYNQLLEIQIKFKETYARHTKEPLLLSNLNIINIDVYSKRKEAIKAYLVNKKNIADNKKQLESISEQLITEEQKETRIEQKISFLDDELIRRIISSEGRLLVNEVLEYTSIATEYQNIGIKIDKDGYQGRTFAEIEQIANDTKEKLKAATISYEVMPNVEKKKILDEISLESVEANYHLVLVKILEEIFKPSTNCDEAIHKREKINDLLQYRKAYLEKLGVKHGIDPFARLHISEQLNELKQYESNSRIISKLRRELANTNSRIESLVAENVQNSTVLEETSYAIKNNDYTSEPEPSFNDLTIDVIIPSEVHVLDNQVTGVTDVADNFNYKKCQEVTQGVIKRVYQILTEPVIISPPQPSAPELIIEQKINAPEVEISSEEIISTEESIVPQPTTSLSEEPVVEASETSTAILSNLSENLPEIELLSDELIEDDDFPDIEEEILESPLDTITSDETDLFTDTNPFETPTMFTEKIDQPEVKQPDTPSAQSEPIQEDVFPEIVEEDDSAEFYIELSADTSATVNTDFWSTDANVNNITNLSLELPGNISPRRKGL